MNSQNDDHLMDELLRTAMSAEAPQLSPGFDARVMQQARPRRLSRTGRLVIAAYTVAATATTIWLMLDLPPGLVVASLAIVIPAALAAGAYGRYLALKT